MTREKIIEFARKLGKIDYTTIVEDFFNQYDICIKSINETKDSKKLLDSYETLIFSHRWAEQRVLDLTNLTNKVIDINAFMIDLVEEIRDKMYDILDKGLNESTHIHVK